MRKTSLTLCILALLAVPVSTAKAQDAAVSCEALLAYPQDSGIWTFFETMTLGFLTGNAFATNSDLEAVQVEGAMGWITGYCRSHPKGVFKDVATDYALAMLISSPGSVTAKGGIFPCKLIFARNSLTLTWFETWTKGFLAGVAFATNNALGTVRIESAMGWIGNYCRVHPEGLLTDAAGEYALAMLKAAKQP